MKEAPREYKGFSLINREELPEFKALGFYLRHQNTGMEVYHVHCEDPDNLFSFALKTIPENSQGVAHILEHSVLCGSKRFPVKDPFMLLLKGSMNTFLNALTFPDKTVYPASSTVPKDLFNLMDVYADAVFFPILSPEMFRQEGHRVEFNSEGSLERTGIVYNEMKGNYSTQDSVVSDWTIRGLFPNHPYGHDSGGDPKEIPKLDYKTFKEFHQKYYNPSNTRLFLYGNIPTQDFLDFIDDRILSKYEKNPTFAAWKAPSLEVQGFSAPQKLVVPYPADENDDADGTASVSVSWLLPKVEDPLTVLSWEILTEILMGSSASPLQRALVDSGLGEDMASASGLETEIARMVFSVGLRGTHDNKAETIQELIMDTLKAIVAKGLEDDLVEGTIRRFEFRAREIKGGPFGLRLMRRSLRGWIHGLHPSVTMQFSPIMESLRQTLRTNPRWFTDLIQAHLIDNHHRTTLIVVADPSLNKREEEELARELQSMEASMGTTQKSQVMEEAKNLQAWQDQVDSPEARASIPFLGKDDIPKKVSTIKSNWESLEVTGYKIPVMTHSLFANGISYLDIVMKADHLTASELVFLPLYLSMTSSLGVEGMGYEAMSKAMGLETGGFNGYPETSMDLKGTMHVHVFWRLRVLDGNIKAGWDLAKKLLGSADYTDFKRMDDLFTEISNEARNAIIPSGSAYASLRAERRLSPAEALEETWRGISQIQLMEALAKELGPRVSEFLGRVFTHLTSRLIHRRGLIFNLTGEDAAIKTAKDLLASWAGSLTMDVVPSSSEAIEAILAGFSSPAFAKAWTKECETAVAQSPMDSTIEALTLSSKVAFNALALKAPNLGTKDYASLSLLCQELWTGGLMERIRMKGGAYGAQASAEGLSGLLTFASYRDPNIVATYKAFKDALEDIVSKGVDPSNIHLATIGSVSRDLRPLSPAETGFMGLRRAMYGVSDEIRQANRDFTLAITPQDLVESAKKVIDAWPLAQGALVAGPELVDKESNNAQGLVFKRTDLGTGS